ncbi:MAG: YigZ family protein [Bacteroidota bacterium]
MSDEYLTLTGPSEGIYKEKGSRFYAFAAPVTTVAAAEAHVAEIGKKYHDARHVCYAYRLGPSGEPWRANDDGEPAHSAGDPILNELKSRALSDAVIAVVRYFGGTKLGVGGLIRAYGTAAADALDHNTSQPVLLTERVRIRFPYALTSEVNRIAHRFALKPAEADYGADCRLSYDIRRTQAANVAAMFEDLGILVR